MYVFVFGNIISLIKLGTNMLDTITAFKAKHGREPNKSELHDITKISRVTIQKRIAELVKAKKARKIKPIITVTADYELL